MLVLVVRTGIVTKISELVALFFDLDSDDRGESKCVKLAIFIPMSIHVFLLSMCIIMFQFKNEKA